MMANSSRSSSLQSLLQLCQSLHDDSLLSLRQLVPVHESLIRAATANHSSAADYDASGVSTDWNQHEEKSSLQRIVVSICWSDQDREVCLRELKKSDERKLLMVQYLLSLCPDDPLQGLGMIVAPVLDNKEWEACDELREAILDALFLQSAPDLSNDFDRIRPCLTTIMDLCEPYDEYRWKTGCRILVRLQQWFESQTNIQDIICSTVVSRIIQGGERAVRKEDDLPSLMRPITVDLLPLLEDSPDSIAKLWKCVWKMYTSLEESDSKLNTGPVLSVCTTILCSILPVNLNQSLPVHDQDENLTPLRQPILWELIYKCLSQGNHVPKKLSWVEESWKSSSPTRNVDPATSQLLRRRGLYMLRVLVENSDLLVWNKYVACFETLEMELEAHLVDQVWETVAELCAQMPDEEERSCTPPLLSWSWMSVILARIITSHDTPVLRKLSLYRFFKGQAGILMNDAEMEVTTVVKKKKTRNARSKASRQGAPLSKVAIDFVLQVVLPAFDTLEQSVGTFMHLEENGKVVKEDMYELLRTFLDLYLQTLCVDETRLLKFFQGIWSPDLACQLHRKTTVELFRSVATTLRSHEEIRVPVNDSMLQLVVESFQKIFSLGSIVQKYHESLLRDLATMLAHSKPIGRILPRSILDVIALFPPPNDSEILLLTEGFEQEVSWIDKDPAFRGLQQWLDSVGEQSPSWASTSGSAISTAFVDGLLLSTKSEDWDFSVGTTHLERKMGQAISVFCALATHDSEKQKSTASELMWPAIHKGLANTSAAMIGTIWQKADRVSRAILLLEHGCRLRVLSGMGNGDLVVDRRTQQMMPPPPNIESMLADSISFIIHHIRMLMKAKTGSAERTSGGGSRSSDATRISATFSRLITQLQTLHEGFPSSFAIASSVENILKESIEVLSKESDGSEGDTVQRIALVYASLTCGGEVQSSRLLETSSMILNLKFAGPTGGTSTGIQPARSVFHYAKWGALSCLLPRVFEEATLPRDGVLLLVDEVVDETADAVEATPMNALLPLFTCVVITARGRFWAAKRSSSLDKTDVQYLGKVIHSLFSLMEDCKNSVDAMHMLDEICSLIFTPALLLGEEERLREDPDSFTPILDSFRRLIKMAGKKRPHVSRAVLCRITLAWLGPEDDNNARAGLAGLAALPYRLDIVGLLEHKENRMDESSTSQSAGRGEDIKDGLGLPSDTDELSIARGFILVFLSKLPDVDKGLDAHVLSDLLHYLIFKLLDDIHPRDNCVIPMIGTPEYCLKMRGWQALCVLSRFVTEDIAERVCAKVFEALAEPLYGQIRYFIEIFTIRCSRKHTVVFGKALIEQITRNDLTLQQIASLMIISGNLVVGRYKTDFFRQYGDSESGDTARLHLLLAAVIPWLSSTQGFSRAIAQLLVHELVPLVIDVELAPSGPGIEDSNWCLRSIYKFLNENSEMKRLRKKQANFFDRYEIDEVCTAEGVLSIPVDEGHEANPVHMIEAIKECLQEVYAEAHVHESPTWRQVEEILEAQQAEEAATTADSTDVVNFQRKIIPIDALNLAFEEMRDKRLRNVAGRRKQQLIVCASLVDKVPNLGGLARTAEIFAADRLVIPDLRVTKMDNFKSLSVGAGDWIEIEECNEENLLRWLRAHKEKGYYVVGIEQTSYSVSLSQYEFPDRPTILLLGKEKEGIPVEYLNLVDVCLEIPQLGIIRSLNVHVSGAISIWEFTRQRIADQKLHLGK